MRPSGACCRHERRLKSSMCLWGVPVSAKSKNCLWLLVCLALAIPAATSTSVDAAPKCGKNCKWSPSARECMCWRSSPQKPSQDFQAIELEKQRQELRERQRQQQAAAERARQAQAHAEAERQRLERARAEAAERQRQEAEQRRQERARAEAAERQRQEAEQRRQEQARAETERQREAAEMQRQEKQRAEAERQRREQAERKDRVVEAKGKDKDKDKVKSEDAPTGVWMHNGSRLRLATEGDQVTLEYDKPRNGLSDLGISSGTVLFKGSRIGNSWTGQVSTFSRQCGEQKFDVTGSASGNDRRLQLRGKRPNLDNSCNVTSYREEVLTFERKSAVQ